MTGPRYSRRAVLGLLGTAALAGCHSGSPHDSATVAPEVPATTDPSPGAAVQPGKPQGTVRASAPASPSAAPAGSAAPVKIGGGSVAAYRGKVRLGAYLSLKNMSLTQALALRRRQLGRDERIVHLFYEFGDPLPTGVPGLPAGAALMLSWKGEPYPDILSGKYDKLIATGAKRLAQDGKPKLLRWAWEMNGNWYPWSGSLNTAGPAGFVACWQRVHKIFQANGAHNVSWVWSPNWNAHPDTAANGYQAYYPGDAYVDWVGVSGYNLYKETPATLYEPLYQAYASRKPMMITECGAVDRGGSTKADWIDDFAAYVRKRPNIAGVCWFDTDTHKDYPEKWRVDTSASSLAAYRTMAQDPRFAG